MKTEYMWNPREGTVRTEQTEQNITTGVGTEPRLENAKVVLNNYTVYLQARRFQERE